jgi:hypothetical protein
MSDLRLGDVIDDFCVKCRRLTNHSVVSLVEGKAAKVRCRTCYSDHDYRNEQAPPSKKDLKKAAVFAEVLTKAAPAAAAGDHAGDPTGDRPTQEHSEAAQEVSQEASPAPLKKARGKKS